MANPELIIYNGKIYPRPDHSPVEALAIHNGRVTGVGSNSEILKLRSASVETMDLHSSIVLPGLADSHIHLLGYGMLTKTLDLANARSITDIQEMLAHDASSKTKDAWITGRGWDQEKLVEHRYPNRHDLDLIANPVFLRRICGHIAVANSLALSAMGIDESVPNPDGGEIVRDSSGKPTGVLKERALEILRQFPSKDEEEVKQALLVATEKLSMLGLTSLHCIIEDGVELKVLRGLKEEGKIPQTINAILPLSMLDQVGSWGGAPGKWNDGFRIGGLKVFLDGSLGARTAALRGPYLDEPNSSGMLTTNKKQLSEILEKARESGLQVCLHAIGDRAVETGIDSLKEAYGYEICRHSRHRIEHASLTSPDLIAKMAKLGVVASVQPRFILSDSWAEQRLGAERIHNLYAFKTMLRKGIRLAAGSDAPVENPSPFEGLWSAVSRPGLSPDEQLTVGETLSCYTTGAAYASFSEDDEGTLEVGKKANMVILDGDPYESSRDGLRNLKVVRTVIEGRVARWN